MRNKLTEIISTLDLFNGVKGFPYNTEIETKIPSPPQKFSVSEMCTNVLKETLLNEKFDVVETSYVPVDNQEGYVMSFDEFIIEGKTNMMNVSSYFGCLDDEEEE